MSDGEQIGQCRREITAAYESTRFKPSDSDMLIADAIDRLAADVEAIKAAVCDGSVAAERDRFLAGVGSAIKERDAAIRERDEWKEEARLAVVNRDEARAEVERLRAIVHSDAGHMAKILIENERLRAAPAAPQPAAPTTGWLTDEERSVLKSHAQSLREQRFALERGGQTLGYSANPGSLKREADIIDALLARAGSPPVVELPLFGNYAPEVLHLRYRDAISRAGVAWKEVPRGQDLK